ncbi:hypothetical protein [Leifsonia aquatica]|uniref:hypothetical protein n=1 Tax=Leifsonia aquatica TaxID=144185 RepID=UPI0004685C1D|nr:hypothetical protein [Leifsonia aquatica]
MTAGRDRFTAVALEHLARAVAADELGVTFGDITARVRDQHGSLAVSVKSPIALPSLAMQTAEPLTARLGDAGSNIRARLGSLTGLAVERVDIRATGAVLTKRRVE